MDYPWEGGTSEPSSKRPPLPPWLVPRSGKGGIIQSLPPPIRLQKVLEQMEVPEISCTQHVGASSFLLDPTPGLGAFSSFVQKTIAKKMLKRTCG